MKPLLFDCGTRDATASLGILALRVLTGLMLLIGHGLPKIKNFDTILKNGFEAPDFIPLSFMSPQVALIATIGAEVVAAGLLIIGFLTRPAAFIIGFTMVVAAFHVHSADPMFFGPGVTSAKELALLYLVPAIAILLSGAGSYSVDAAVYKGSKRRRW